MILVAVTATQWEAARLAYDPALGTPIFGGLYNPFNCVTWPALYGRYRPDVLVPGAGGTVLAWVAGTVALRAWIGLVLRRLRRNEGLHGTAHWAREAEIRVAGLLPAPGAPGRGVYCGAWRDSRGRLLALRHDGPEHVLAIAPTRSGKGVSLVIPTLLSWPASVVVNDPKGELFHLTSGWRGGAGGSRILRFAPGAAEGSCAYNPCAEVRWETIHEVGDIQNVATMVVDPEGKGTHDHWSKTAHALITGLAIHLHYTLRPSRRAVTLADVGVALARPDLDELWDEMLYNTHLKGVDQTWLTPPLSSPNAHPVVVAAATDMKNRASAERSGVLSTAMSFLALYRDPIVARNIGRSDFQISDLVDDRSPVTLYVQVGAEDEQRMRPLTRLLVNQIVEVLMRPEIKFEDGRPVAPHKHRLLLLLDEFVALKRLPKFEAALAVMAGYGIKAYLIIQDIDQLHAPDGYGREETVTSNCHVQIAFPPNKIETAQWLSRNLGQMTVVTEQVAYSGRRWGRMDNVSRSYQQTGRALLTPDEVRSLPGPTKDTAGRIVGPGALLVSVAGHAPILGVQSLYFLVPEFLARSRLAPAAVAVATAPKRFSLPEAAQ